MKKPDKLLKRFMFNPRYNEDYQKILLNRDIRAGFRPF